MDSKKKKDMKIGMLQVPSRTLPPPPPPPPPSSTPARITSTNNPKSSNFHTGLDATELEELQRLVLASPSWKNRKRLLSKQLSMCETARDVAWEKRRRQILRKERKRNVSLDLEKDLTDEDLHELKGSIELGFGFNEEAGQKLCNTLPALDLYFAVNRQFSPATSPRPTTPPSQTSATTMGGRSASFDSPTSSSDESWKICTPGDSPERVKTKLRHWAQAVACSLMQSF